MRNTNVHPNLTNLAHALAVVTCLGTANNAHAWTYTVGAGAKTIFLQVGDGSQSGSTTINTVSVSVAATQLGNGTALPMATTSAQTSSSIVATTVCSPAAGQTYIAAAYRSPSASIPTATLAVNAPTNLVNASGDIIPFTAVSWIASTVGTADTTPTAIPSGTFTGGLQALRSVAANTWIENCHTFSYSNATVAAAGTYTGRVTYTLTSP